MSTAFHHAPSHLTEAQIDDHLIGDLAPEAVSHLNSCTACQARVAELEQPLADFRAVSLAWAERRSATMAPLPAAPARPNHGLAWASLATAATAALAVGIVIPALRHTTSAAPSVTVAALNYPGQTLAASSTSTPEEIARDNQMLDAIDRALDGPVVAPAGYGTAPHHARSHKDRA